MNRSNRLLALRSFRLILLGYEEKRVEAAKTPRTLRCQRFNCWFKPFKQQESGRRSGMVGMASSRGCCLACSLVSSAWMYSSVPTGKPRTRRPRWALGWSWPPTQTASDCDKAVMPGGTVPEPFHNCFSRLFMKGGNHPAMQHYLSHCGGHSTNRCLDVEDNQGRNCLKLNKNSKV